MPITCEINKVAEKLQKAAEEVCNNKEGLAEAYLDYLEAKYSCKDAPLYQFGLTPDKTICEKLTDIQKNDIWEVAIYKKAKQYLDEAWKPETKHQDRRKKIEDAIRLLKRLHEERKAQGKNLKPETLTLLAKAYLRRSKIIRPKGITTPEKKKEAIKKGIDYAKEAIENGGNENAHRRKAMLYIEKERILEESERSDDAIKSEILNALKEALVNDCKKFNNLEEDIKIAVLYSELNDDTTYPYLKDVVESRLTGIELEKARAYRLKKNDAELKKEMKSLIGRLKTIHFSSPLWDDAVRFLVKLYNYKNDTWKELALETWKACKYIEEETPSTLHIRWYWSRQRALYDLAFLAADTDNSKDEQEICKKRVEIAESLKSRPSLRWNVMEEIAKGDEWLKELYEAEAAALARGYVINYDELNNKFMAYKNKLKEKVTDKQKSLDIATDVPKGWIVIHFYLNRLEEKCYALIYNDDKKKWEQPVPFSYDELFNAYIEWQTNYARYKEGATGSLVELCKAIGDKMGFLFDLPKEKSVLFIPHDFLHRLPLHGAIKEKNSEKEVFLTNHQCFYLPAWSFARKKVLSVQNKNKKFLLKNVPDISDDEFSELKPPHLNWTDIKDPASPDDLKGISSPPELLVILCHGKADAVNPFNARLKLAGNGVTHLEILAGIPPKQLEGSCMFLGACETDLVLPLSAPLDEHLSISSAFLGKGASSVLGTMWIVRLNDVVEVIKKINTNAGKSEIELLNWQKTNIQTYCDTSDESAFFRSIAFRIIVQPGDK